MSSDIGNRRSRIETQGAFRFRLLRWAARRSTQPGGFVEGSDLVNNELTHDERAGPPAPDFDSAPSERLARRLLHALAERNAGLGLLYSVLDVAVSELGLTRAAVVMDEPPFARQLFRAGRRVEYDDGFLATQAPGLYAEPALDPGSDIAEMVTDACRLALRLLPAVDDDVRTALSAREAFEQRFDAAISHALRTGCEFTFVRVEPLGSEHSGAIEERLLRTLRRDDGLFSLPGRELALVLLLAPGDEVGVILERAASAVGRNDSAVCPPFTYSVVNCPDEATDATAALALARDRHVAVSESLARDAAPDPPGHHPFFA